MKANWKKSTRSKTKGLDSFQALRRWAIILEQESMARAERQATAMGGSFIAGSGVGGRRLVRDGAEDERQCADGRVAIKVAWEKSWKERRE